MMAYRLALELPQRFAAVAAVAANVPANSECPLVPALPVSVLIMNGTADTFYMPYGGGQVAGNRGLVLSSDATRGFFLDALDAAPPVQSGFPDLDPQDGGTVGVDVFPTPSGREVAYLRVDGGAHNYPSIAHPLPPQVSTVVGPQNHDVEAAAEIWTFLSRQVRASAVPSLAMGPAALLAASGTRGQAAHRQRGL
jgi:polyhydroxybutyrate depolymerase